MPFTTAGKLAKSYETLGLFGDPTNDLSGKVLCLFAGTFFEKTCKINFTKRTGGNMHDKKIYRVFHRELLGCILIYTIIWFISNWFAKGMHVGLPRILITLLPILPAFGVLWALMRHFRRMDEYYRIWALENVAMAGGLTAIFSLIYDFMEGVGFPRLGMHVVFFVYSGGWLAIGIVRRLTIK